jgi:hypothetical protein
MPRPASDLRDMIIRQVFRELDSRGAEVLSDSDKQRIRAEEIFRSEVRRELEAKKRQLRGWQRAWSLANTSFGIWFLSTIVIGLVTWSYSSVQEHARTNERKAETVRKLDTELTGRIHGALVQLEALRRRLEGKAYDATRSETFATAVQALDSANSIYPEYRSRSFSSLVLELGLLVPIDEQASLRVAAAAYEELKFVSQSGNRSGRLGGNLQLDESRVKEIAKDIDDASQIISEKIESVKRWKIN